MQTRLQQLAELEARYEVVWQQWKALNAQPSDAFDQDEYELRKIGGELWYKIQQLRREVST